MSEVTISTSRFYELFEHVVEIAEWMTANNVRWLPKVHASKDWDNVILRFNTDREAVLFKLRWL